MQKLIGVLTLTLIAVSLRNLPAAAVTGQIDGGLQVNQAICVNSTALHTSTVSSPGTTFDCGAGFSAAPGDQITIILVATGVTDGPDPLCNTTPIIEQEPNNNFVQVQDIGTLPSGGCITAAGHIDTGSDRSELLEDPNADFDHYLLSPVGVSHLRIDFGLAAAQTLRFVIFDADTQIQLEDQGPTDAIEVAVPAQTSRIMMRVSTDVPSDYTLTFSDRSNAEDASLRAFAARSLKVEEHP